MAGRVGQRRGGQSRRPGSGRDPDQTDGSQPGHRGVAEFRLGAPCGPGAGLGRVRQGSRPGWLLLAAGGLLRLGREPRPWTCPGTTLRPARRRRGPTDHRIPEEARTPADRDGRSLRGCMDRAACGAHRRDGRGGRHQPPALLAAWRSGRGRHRLGDEASAPGRDSPVQDAPTHGAVVATRCRRSEAPGCDLAPGIGPDRHARGDSVRPR
jgi:hypothetical protein